MSHRLSFLLPLLLLSPLHFIHAWCGTETDLIDGKTPCQITTEGVVNTRDKYTIGTDRAAMYVIVTRPREASTLRVETRIAQFFPKVDKLTRMEFNMTNWLNEGDPAEVKVTVAFAALGADGNATLFKTHPKRWFSSDRRSVPYRSVIVSLNDGVFEKVTWESTICPNAPRDVEDMCATQSCADCAPSKIYVMWSGTDKQKRILNSASSSIYRLKMLSNIISEDEDP